MVCSYYWTHLIIYLGCWVEEIRCLKYINYETSEVYSRDPFKQPDEVLFMDGLRSPIS